MEIKLEWIDEIGDEYLLSDDEVSNICMSRLAKVESATQIIQDERETSLQYYNSEPYGDEVEGRSSFVTSDVRDTIEWILPQLVEMFIGTDAPGSFAAKNAEDAEAARIESSYVQDVFNNQNNGFLICYEWFKDALLQKNGYVKSYWDERVDEVNETYEGQTYEQYLQIASDEDVEIDEVTFRVGEEEYSLEEFEKLPIEMALLAEVDIECTRQEDNSKLRIETIAPENFFTDIDHPSIDLSESSLCCERVMVTASDLLVDGYSKDIVESIPSSSEGTLDTEHQERFKDEAGGVQLSTEDDDSMRPIVTYNFYIRMDADGDGKAELRYIRLAGPGGEVVLENEEADSNVYSALTPVINPHKHFGMSYADLVRDLQLLRSVLWRQVLDNLYLSNNPIKIVDPSRANTEDLLTASPGAIWRAQEGAVTSFATPFVAGNSVQIMPMIDEMRQERTGVSPLSQGIDVKALADSTNLVGPMIMTQAMQRIRMVARTFAETGFKHLMLRIHELCSKHDQSERVFNVNGDYQTTDPRNWAKRKSWNVRVGVGHVDRAQRMQAINAILLNQKEIAVNAGIESPVLSAQSFHEALVEQAKLLGYPDGAKFYRDPATYQPPPKEDAVSEALQIEEARTVADIEKTRMENDINIIKHKDNLALERDKLSAETAYKKKQLAQERELQREEMIFKYGHPPKGKKNAR